MNTTKFPHLYSLKVRFTVSISPRSVIKNVPYYFLIFNFSLFSRFLILDVFDSKLLRNKKPTYVLRINIPLRYLIIFTTSSVVRPILQNIHFNNPLSYLMITFCKIGQYYSHTHTHIANCKLIFRYLLSVYNFN